MGTLRLVTLPKNREHFVALWAFFVDVLAVCDALGVEPVVNASLAVLAHTGCADLEVHDVDLSCPEAAFDPIVAAFGGTDVVSDVREWHVLELHRGALKVEFDAAEVWMQGVDGPHCELAHGSARVRMVNREDLATLYARGVAACAGRDDAAGRARYEDLRWKLELVQSR
jgi:hypothetical protein